MSLHSARHPHKRAEPRQMRLQRRPAAQPPRQPLGRIRKFEDDVVGEKPSQAVRGGQPLPKCRAQKISVIEEILPLLEDKNNHTIDAVRYALEELRRTGYKPAEEARKQRRRPDYGHNTEPVRNWKTA